MNFLVLYNNCRRIIGTAAPAGRVHMTPWQLHIYLTYTV